MTYEEVKARYDYDPAGFLLHKRGPHQHSGKRAGYADAHKKGYWVIECRGKRYPAHRLIYLWHHGTYPVYSVDHINRVKTDNRIENLRDGTPSEQNQNVEYAGKNRTGYRGIDFRKDKQRYRGVVGFNGKKHKTKNYKTADAAYKAYCELVVSLYGPNACLE